MRPLSDRLSLIASLVPENTSVCDVGTDHGYLPAFLYLSGKFSKVTATDINEKPLINAKYNTERLGAKGVELLLCDGLDKVCRQDADTVIIAGMGGDVISGILNRSGFIKDKDITLILQPMTASDALRKYLAENGFAVKKEQAVKENGKFYSVMVCSFENTPYEIDEVRLRIGILHPDNEISKEYINKQLKICEKCGKDLERCGDERYKEFFNISSQLKKLTEE